MRLVFETVDKNTKIEDILKRAHDNDAGMDIILQNDIVIEPGKNKIPLGFKCVLPVGLAAYIFPRSSIMGDGIQFNLAPIDPDYSNEYNLICYNVGNRKEYKKGTRICQLVVMPFVYIDPVDKYLNKRGDNGIGSTGI